MAVAGSFEWSIHRVATHSAAAGRAAHDPFRTSAWRCVARCGRRAMVLRQNRRHARQRCDIQPDSRPDCAFADAACVRDARSAQPGVRGGDRGVPVARVQLPVLPDAGAIGVHRSVLLVQHRRRAPARRTLGVPPRREQHTRFTETLARLAVDGADPDRRQHHRLQRRRRRGRLAARHSVRRLLARLLAAGRVVAGAVVDPRRRHHLLVLFARNHCRQRGRRAGGAAPGRRAPAQAARIAAGAAHAVQHAREPARADRPGPDARPGDARPVDLVPARHACGVACRAARPFGRVREARRLPGADAGAHGRPPGHSARLAR